MPTNTPYRASAESRAAAPPALLITLDDAEDRTNPIKVFHAVLVTIVVVALLWTASPPIAGVVAAVMAVGLVVVFRKPAPRGVGLEVLGDTLVISRPGEPQPTTVSLAAIDNVEIERKAIQRVTYQQQISEAVPTTELSGDVEVARIVLRLAGDAAPERLAETWAPVFVCMDRFGEVRTYLRAHGWVPLPERD